MGLIEDDDTIETRTQPIDDLLQARRLDRAIRALPFVRTQRGIGREEDPLGKINRRALLEAGQWDDLELLLPEG